MTNPHPLYTFYPESGIANSIRRTAAFSFQKVFWRRAIIKELPIDVLWYWFEIRSVLVPWTSDANPLRLIWVDPADIEYYHSGGPWRFGHVVGGDWDVPQQRFENTTLHQSLVDRFTNGQNWEDTDLYNKYNKELNSGKKSSIKGVTDIDSYFETIDQLYYRIDSQGYLTQQTILNREPEKVKDSTHDNPHPALNEICVNIYRDGTLAKRSSGNHRLSIAKILDIDKIPVVVRVRHKKWQKLRDKIRNSDNGNEIGDQTHKHLGHPDLRNLYEGLSSS
ncbi:hypothetical protein [Natronolimnohabitans innermongolicus]|uniref:hypothetical protein n=1 Tax=Natronolimnohabitans innermongolicus TaxID=253107 RepID=UPI001269790D|nr:hypothetical protein [Natronolimnohabitans innermongolicus]